MFYLDHVGITTEYYEETIRFYQALDFAPMKSWSDEGRRMQACMLKNPEGKCIEIFHFDPCIPPPDTVGSHFARDGQAIEEDLPQVGLKHVAFRVKNLDEVVERLRAQGLCQEVDIMPGGLGNRYLFLRDPNGIFVEFMENPYIQDDGPAAAAP